MSERKVLNKYFPPDFDPSKIPRCKEPRNKTFVIRLMAPCNMRCTTCGEYIYKGRKFNARKEDVDDMNHLGLRIYRFYIKCTACLSEISFRTDPANTDYVLEAGATRNFEALAKAEKQAEEEERARQEELATNPMKLLEERTEASKNEMARMEALEELQELNKREVKVDYEHMLAKYEQIRRSEAAKQEEEDERYVKTLFGKDGDVKVKRIVEEDDSDEESERRRTEIKKFKTSKPTDLLGENKKPAKEAWDKSIGTLGAISKNKLGVLVKKKDNGIKKEKDDTVVKTEIVENVTENSTKLDNSDRERSSKSLEAAEDVKPTGLGLLGAYSDSDDSS